MGHLPIQNYGGIGSRRAKAAYSFLKGGDAGGSDCFHSIKFGARKRKKTWGLTECTVFVSNGNLGLDGVCIWFGVEVDYGGAHVRDSRGRNVRGETR